MLFGFFAPFLGPWRRGIAREDSYILRRTETTGTGTGTGAGTGTGTGTGTGAGTGTSAGTGDLVSVAAGAYLYRSDRPQAGRLK